jgi:hypothetical protein
MGMGGYQGNFVLEPREFWIAIEIEIVIEIDFWQLSDFDSDFDFDGYRPSLRVPLEPPAIYALEIILLLQRTKMPWGCYGDDLTTIPLAHYVSHMQTQPAPSPISPPPFSKDFLANPEFRAMVRNELSDILTDFIATQEKRASEVSLIERIVRVEEAQRSHEQLTRALLEQINLRFEEMQRNMDKRFDAMDKRFEAVDKRFEAMDKRFESMDKRFESMDNRFNELGRRLDRFMFWSLGLTVSATFLIITMLR